MTPPDDLKSKIWAKIQKEEVTEAPISEVAEPVINLKLKKKVKRPRLKRVITGRTLQLQHLCCFGKYCREYVLDKSTI